MSEAAKRSGYQYDHIRRLVKSGAVATLEIAPRKYLIDYESLERYKAEKPQRHSRPSKEKSEDLS